MADNKYLKSSEPPAEVQKEPVKPVAKTTLKKKGFFRKTKDFLFSGDTRDVKDYIVEETIKPAVRDGIYDVIMNFVEGMIFGETSRRRRKSGNKYERILRIRATIRTAVNTKKKIEETVENVQEVWILTISNSVIQTRMLERIGKMLLM